LSGNRATRSRAPISEPPATASRTGGALTPSRWCLQQNGSPWMLPYLLGWPGWIGRRGGTRCGCWIPTARSEPVSTCPHRQRATRVDPLPGPARRGPGRDRATDGPVVEALLAAGLEVVVIPGRQVKALRGRYARPATRRPVRRLGTRRRTAYRHRLAPLCPDAPETTALRVVSRARKSLVATRVALANELRANLEISFPGAATLFSDVDSPIALAFLRRSPSVTRRPG
jgi:hypothetical protein